MTKMDNYISCCQASYKTQKSTDTIEYAVRDTLTMVARRSILWNTLRDEIKVATSIITFEKEIRYWYGKNRTCHICT